MTLLASRVDDLMQAPVAAAMFTLAARHGLDAEHLADPAMASTALRDLNPWTGKAAANRVQALDAVQPLRDLVTTVAADPRNAWWSAQLDRTAQLLLTGSDDGEPDPMQLPVSTGPIDSWEVYAQKPARRVVTSTELVVPATQAIRSGAHAELACGSSDWNPTYPVRQMRLEVAPTTRVFEVDSPADWYSLVLRYGDPATHPGPDPNLRDAAGLDNGLAPTWSAVAADYDGVHLTFAGLLTGLYVPITTGDVSTTLWAWEWECTHWMRSVFTTATALPHLSEAPDDAGYYPG